MVRNLFFAALMAVATGFSPLRAHAAIGDQLARLRPNDTEIGSSYTFFGTTVAINGNRAIVGARGDDNAHQDEGAAYLFDVPTGAFIARLSASDGAAFDGFGSSVALSGNRAIIGAPYKSDFARSSGAAYLFDITTGAQTGKLLPSDPAADGYFGGSVAISGNTVLVGGNSAVYLFDFATGSQIGKLLPNDGGSSFGGPIAISGNTVIVGASGDDQVAVNCGAAYLFDIPTRAQIAKLIPSDGASQDTFGFSVAIDGNTAIVGSLNDDDMGLQSGSAYLFDVSTGNQIAKLVAPDGAMNDQFGISVAANGRTAIIGAYFDDDRGADSGSAYMFDIPTRSLLAKLHSNDAETDDYFGSAVSISGTTALVGAYWKDYIYPSTGAAYLFDSTNPLPEPSSLVCLGAPCAVALLIRRRRNAAT